MSDGTAQLKSTNFSESREHSEDQLRPWLISLAKVASVVVLLSGAALAWMQLYVSFRQHDRELSLQREKEANAQRANADSQRATTEANTRSAELQFKIKQLE